MACIDFSFDSRIRKKYVPLVTQQRYLRHVKRISARNLSLPEEALRSLIVISSVGGEDDEVGKTILDYLDGDGKPRTEDFDYQQEVSPLLSRLNLYFFFTIHLLPLLDCDHRHTLCSCDQLLYISELARGSSPAWKSFEGLALVSPSISRFLIRIHYLQLIDGILPQHQEPQTTNLKFASLYPQSVTFLAWDVHLSGLVYVGEEVPKDARLAGNTIIIGCAEGFYTSLDCIASEELKNHIAPLAESYQLGDGEVLRDSYSHEKLTRIQMFQIIIRNTAVGATEAKTNLEICLERDTIMKELRVKLEKTQSSIDFLTDVLKKRTSKISTTKYCLAETENKIFEHSSVMSQRMQILKEEIKVLLKFKSTSLTEARRRLEKARSAIVARRRLMAKEVFVYIYPIVPFPDFSGYTIRGVFLPDSRSKLIEKHDSKMISVALGYVAHLFVVSSSLLDVLFHHQLVPCGSRSLIVDLINGHLHENERVLPLFLGSGKSPIYFKYGLFLLNEMIMFNRRLLGRPGKSGSATLANLYALFTECLLVDNYSVKVDSTLNQFDDYTPSLQISYREARAQNDDGMIPAPRPIVGEEADLLNQHFLNDINVIKDNDVMNDQLWKEVERLTELVDTSILRLTAKERGKEAPVLTEDELQRQNIIFLEDARRTIMNQRKVRRSASNRRLSQVTSSLTSSWSSGTGGSAFSTPPTNYSSATSTPSWLYAAGSPSVTPRSGSTSESVAISSKNVRKMSTSSVVSSAATSQALISTSPKQFDDPSSFRHFNSIRRSLQASESAPQTSFLHPGDLSSPSPPASNVSSNNERSTIRKLSTSSFPCTNLNTSSIPILNNLGPISSSLDHDLNNSLVEEGTKKKMPRRTRFSSQSSITSSPLVVPGGPAQLSGYLNVEMVNSKYDSDSSSLGFAELPMEVANGSTSSFVNSDEFNLSTKASENKNGKQKEK